MRRRDLLAAAGGAALLALTGCSSPEVRSGTTASGADFTPEGASTQLARCKSLEDVERVYGDFARKIKDAKRHEGLRGYVWEWLAARPSFFADKTERPYQTPTVKKELHVWFDHAGRIADHEVVGFFYVQVKRPALPLIMTGVRELSTAEVASGRIPSGIGEVLEEVNAWHAAKGLNGPAAPRPRHSACGGRPPPSFREKQRTTQHPEGKRRGPVKPRRPF